jgi:hypothetical protein
MAALRKIAPFARLTLFIACCAGVLLYADYRSARASVMERLLGVGQRMAPFLDDGRSTEAPRELHINGVKLWAAAGQTSQPPALVRRFYADRYAGRGSAMDTLAEELKRQHALPATATGLTQASFGDDTRGGMAALDSGDGVDLRSLARRLAHAGDGKMGEVGRLRYVYWERSGNGGTRFLTVWTDDKLDLAKLLPASDGDVPGRDVPNVPRYPGTRRILAADERGAFGAMAVYAGSGSPELALAFYTARLNTLGWQLDPRFSDVASRQGNRTLRAVSRDGHEVMIDCSDAPNDVGGRDLVVTVIALR